MSIDDARILNREIFDRAKLLWALVLWARVVAGGVGACSIILGWTSSLVTGLIVILAAIAEVLLYFSDKAKSDAESMLRKIEYADGLGISIQPIEFVDHLVGMGKKRRASLESALRENYFVSTKEGGPERVIANLRESSWWTQHLSRWMAICCGVGLGVLVAVCGVALYVTMTMRLSDSRAETTNKVIALALSTGISVGLVKLMIGYAGMHRKASDLERKLRETFGMVRPTQVEALQYLHEYQISRASAPLVPNMIWKVKRDQLNELWGRYGQLEDKTEP